MFCKTFMITLEMGDWEIVLSIVEKSKNMENPIKNVTGIFSCLFDGSLLETGIKSDGNPIIFLANAPEIP